MERIVRPSSFLDLSIVEERERERERGTNNIELFTPPSNAYNSSACSSEQFVYEGNRCSGSHSAAQELGLETKEIT